jgi:hypothetical protein
MQLNGTSLVDRNNRPTVLQKVGLRAFFINDGEYVDPHDISAVTVFDKSANFTPSTILNDNLISSGITSGIIRMNFAPSGEDGGYPAQDPSGYNPGTDIASTSGVYRVAKGEYVVVLDGTQNTSGVYNLHGSSVVVENSASAVRDYIDVWTVMLAEGSTYQSLINDFHLYDDTFFVTTEPVLLTAYNKLINKHVVLGSKEDLKITTDITINNRNIDSSIKNIFKESAIINPQILIEKLNEGTPTLPAHVTVSGYADTSSLIDITSDNTMVFNFDTTTLETHSNIADFGGLVGQYRLTVKYNLLNELIVTPPLYFTLS